MSMPVLFFFSKKIHDLHFLHPIIYNETRQL